MTTEAIAVPSLKRRLVSGGAWALAGRLASVLSGAAVSALLARLLPPEELGAYFLVLSLVAAATLLGQVGMNYTAVRLIAESTALGDSGRARSTVSGALRIGLLVSSALGVVLLLGPGHWLVTRVFRLALPGELLVLVAVLVPVHVVQGLQAAAFQGFHDMRRAALFGGPAGAFGLVVLLTALLLLEGHATLLGILLATVAIDLAAVFPASLCLARKIAGLRGEGRVANSELLGLSLPVLLTSLALWLLTQSDLWILGFFRSAREVALYGAASRLVLLIAVLLTVVNTVVAPLISELYAQRRLAELEKMLRGTASAVLFPACLALLFFLGAGERILALVYGGSYGEAVTALGILAAGQVFNVWAGSCGLALIMIGEASLMMRVTLCSALLTVLAALVLVQGYGITGVALASTFGLVLQNLLLLFCVKRKAGIWTHARLARPDYRLLWEGGKHG